MKYLVYDDKGDVFIDEFEKLEEALQAAEYQWKHLTMAEKEERTAFYVLESADPDEGSESHFDGNIVKQYK